MVRVVAKPESTPTRDAKTIAWRVSPVTKCYHTINETLQSYGSSSTVSAQHHLDVIVKSKRISMYLCMCHTIAPYNT